MVTRQENCETDRDESTASQTKTDEGRHSGLLILLLLTHKLYTLLKLAFSLFLTNFPFVGGSRYIELQFFLHFNSSFSKNLYS